MAAGRVWEGAVCVILYLIAVVSCQAKLRFGDRDVRNNSYVLRGDIPGGPGGVNGLLCASDTTNPTTRQWYDRDGDALGTTNPTNGVYQANDSASGGVLLYTAGTVKIGLRYCRISDSSGNIQTLYAGLYTSDSEKANDGPDIVGGIQFELKTAPNVDPPVFQLTCTSSTAPATTVQWTKDGSPVSGGSSSQIVTDRTEATTYINELTVTGRQSGMYNCTVTTWRAYRDDEMKDDTMVGSSATASITVEAAPAPPTGVTAVQEGSVSVNVSWTQSGTVTEYWINYVSAGGEDSGSAGPITGTSPHTLDNLLDGLAYTITVIAMGEHLPSEGSQGTDVQIPILPPSNLMSPSETNTTISISWDHIPNSVISYEVSYTYQGPCSGVDDSGTETVAAPLTQHTLMGLEEFSAYMITVRAVYNGIYSGNDSISAPTLPSAPSGAPENVREVEVTSTSISIQWDQVPCIEQNSDITGYIVRYSNSTGETQMATGQMFTASGLTPSTTYSFQVAAVNSDDEVGPYSSTLEINTVAPTIGVVSNVRVDVLNETAVTVMWGAVQSDEVSKYTVYYSQSSVKKRQQNDGSRDFPADATSGVIGGLVTGVEYQFQVTMTLLFNGVEFEGNRSLVDSDSTVTPAYPPQVTVHPVDQTNIVPGSDASFNVTATSIIPLSYQWQKDGVDLTDGGSITGANTATLTITGVMESDEGGYRCVVTNDAGPVTSNTATLTVVDPPEVTVHPVHQTNIVPESDVSFSVTATSTAPLSYQWQKDGVDLTDGDSITGATTATLAITDVMESDEGGYRCVVTNIAGMVTSNTAMLTLVTPGGGSAAAAAGGAIGGILVVLVIVAVVVIVVVLVLRKRSSKSAYISKQPADHTYDAMMYDKSTESVQEKLSAPVIEEFPEDIDVVEGQSVTLQVRVTGDPTPTLTWYHDGQEVAADYSIVINDDGSLFIPSSEPKQTGNYRLMVQNKVGKAEKYLHLGVSTEGEASTDGALQDLKPVPVAEFGTYVSRNHASNNQGFREQYTKLDSGSEHPTTIGTSAENRPLNRFANITAYDDNITVLKAIPGSEHMNQYINASYINGYSHPKKFIATQGPLPKSVTDFWHLVWQERATSIVMVTNVKEGNKIKCQHYWPDSGSKEYGPFKVVISDQQLFADFVIRTFRVSLSDSSDRPLKVTQFHFTAWPDHGVPDYATPILTFHRKVKSTHISRKPLLVHCSAGVGRTGTFIAIDTVLEQAKKEGVVDIAGVINKLRHQRMKMVQTPDQYTFIHDAILESLTCGDTQVNAGDLQRMISKMACADPQTGLSKYHSQFHVLEQVTPKASEVSTESAKQNPERNNQMKFLPPDSHRVLLKGEHPDYINATFVNGYKQKKAYIIAQGPMQSTCRDFWKMVHERGCGAIVMLTLLEEGACYQYWPNKGVLNYGEMAVELVGEEELSGFVMRTVNVVNNSLDEAAHQVTQFHILNWGQDGKCPNVRTITDVIDEVWKVQRRTGNNPIVVHCSDTVGRSGMFCAIATTIERCKSEGVVDVFQVVKALRIQKPGAVLTVEQYKFVFEAVLVFLNAFDAYANFQ